VEHLIPAEGGPIWAQDSGGPGVPVVLANSDWCDSSSWDLVISRITSPPRIIRYDNRGYGKSPAPAAPFSQAGDLAAVLDYLEAGPAVVAGHSGGGGTAIGLALARPELVGALILAAPGCQDYPWPQDDPYAIEFGALFTAGDRDGLVALGLRTWAPGTDPAAAAAQIRGAVAAFFRQGGYLSDDPPAWPRLGEISVPAVMVIGELDYPMVTDCSAAIAGRIPDCRTVVVPGADHLLPLCAPAVLADLIESATASLSGHNAAPGA
jgi:3-oxoadipate enol-lactonase